MNTPAHLILALAVFARSGSRKVTGGAAAGALLPDASLYVMAGVSLSVLQIPANVVFGQLYYSHAWQTVFAIDNSFLLWGLVLAFALWKDSRVGIAFAGAGLLHLLLDFPLHHDDGRPHFWPASDWVFESPVSYWDPDHYGTPFAIFEHSLALVLLIYLLTIYRQNIAGWFRARIRNES